MAAACSRAMSGVAWWWRFVEQFGPAAAYLCSCTADAAVASDLIAGSVVRGAQIGQRVIVADCPWHDVVCGVGAGSIAQMTPAAVASDDSGHGVLSPASPGALRHRRLLGTTTAVARRHTAETLPESYR